MEALTNPLSRSIMAKTDLTAQRLREVLDYNPKTGVFTCRLAWRDLPAGRTTGTLDNHGYLVIRLDGVLHKAHRLAWLHVHGSHPANEIDHINRVRSDNRLVNLRIADPTLNSHNRGMTTRNKSGFLGTSKARRQWRAQICVRGKTFELGYFKTPQEAEAAYLSAKRELHES